MVHHFLKYGFCVSPATGTSRLQLRAKGDGGVYSNLTSVVLACGGVFIPATHWLVDRRGYGATLATVNILGVLCCVFQVRTHATGRGPQVSKLCRLQRTLEHQHVAAPWLLSYPGYSATLATISVLGVLCCVLQVRRPPAGCKFSNVSRLHRTQSVPTH